MTTEPMRYGKTISLQISDDGAAALVTAETSAGERVSFELERARVPELVESLLTASDQWAKAYPPPLPDAPAVDPDATVLLQPTDLHAMSDLNGNRALGMRVGVFDLMLPLSDPELRAQLLRALTMAG